jgi:hypothetical protein
MYTDTIDTSGRSRSSRATTFSRIEMLNDLGMFVDETNKAATTAAHRFEYSLLDIVGASTLREPVLANLPQGGDAKPPVLSGLG